MFPWIVALTPLGQLVVVRGSHETGFIKGFSDCAHQEETTELHSEEGRALLFIRVSIIEMSQASFVDRNIFWKDIAIMRARDVVCSSLKESFVVWE